MGESWSLSWKIISKGGGTWARIMNQGWKTEGPRKGKGEEQVLGAVAMGGYGVRQEAKPV